jgi:hypothetical protein
MKICNKCSAAADPTTTRGCSKCGGELVSVEEFFYAAIKELNEKGYYVKSAVPGAAGQNKAAAVIIFDECVDSFPTYTEGGLMDYNITAIGSKDSRHIKFTREFGDKDTPQEVLNNSIITYLWAVRLPAVGTDEYFDELKTCYINNMGEDPE